MPKEHSAAYTFPVHDVSDVEIAFPATVSHLMPRKEDIPEEFWEWPPTNKWGKFFSDWFYRGIQSHHITPKKGIDKDKAMRHLACVIRSYEQKHEYKEAAVAFLCSLWFDDVTWTPKELKK